MLKVYGTTVSAREKDKKLEPKYKTQCRYVAAVNNQKEFAQLINASLNFVKNYASITHNIEEVGRALEFPHQLICMGKR